jgi:N-acetylglucosaminyldiphosphoundecaprenol N-acetyl-beta-D-mannosaminyltransferase
MSTKLSTLELFGIGFQGHDKESLLSLINSRIQRQQRTLILSGNVHAFNLAYEQPWLHNLFNQADFIRVDGAGVRLGARLLGRMLPPRMTWADFMWDLAAVSEINQYRIFFLGGRPGVAAVAAETLQQKHPYLQIIDCQHGYFNKMRQHPENETVLREIANGRPDILIVGMGMPLQEQWISDNWEQLNATVIMTAGAVYDYISGRLQRPAPIFTLTGFEWLGRLLLEPRRLWRRYLIGIPLFFWRILKQRLNRL